jgi:putative oxidoreductase
MRMLEGVAPGWGITVVRVMMGIILIVAGFQKFAGGIDGFAGFVGQAGIPAPGLMAPLVATLELLGGLLLLVVAMTRWVALLFILEFLVVAFVVKLPRTGWDASRIDLMMLAGAVMLFLAGPGKAAVDEMLMRRRAEPATAAGGVRGL